MKNPNVKTRVVHSRTESAWNIVGQTLGGKHKAGNLQFTPQWIKVTDRLPEEHKFRMSRDVLTIAGSKINVKSYDYELKKWNGSPHITTTHWMPLPEPPEV